jgi:uncharacterized protein
MGEKEILKKTEKFIREKFSKDRGGHDWWHLQRVLNLAKRMAELEKADIFVVKMSSLLHDLGDYKLEPDGKDRQKEKVSAWLKNVGVSNKDAEAILDIVINLSFSKNITQKRKLSLEGQIVQDADRLDALGAMGISRVFAYAGLKQNPIYNPAVKPKNPKALSKVYKKSQSTAINHFYEKLLLVKDKMNTSAGKRLALQRHEFLELYLKEFFAEWEGRK